MKNFNHFYTKPLLFLLIVLSSCGKDSPAPDNSTLCGDVSKAVFQETGDILAIELENTVIPTGWKLENNIAGFTGNSYLLWEGPSSNSNPGNGLLTYKIQITNPGTYAIKIRSRIAEGNNNTESNDAWLRLPDADDFFAVKGGSTIYPTGSGNTPNPNGAGEEGWFKSYMNQLDTWSWQTKTSDNDAHDIFATFDTAGRYTIELSGRSQGFAIDRIVLYQTSVTQATATDADLAQSAVTCD